MRTNPKNSSGNKKDYVDIYSINAKKNRKKYIGKILAILFFVIMGLVGIGMIYVYNVIQ